MGLIDALFGWKPVVVFLGNEVVNLDEGSLYSLGIIQVHYRHPENTLVFEEETVNLCELPGPPTCPCIIVTSGMEGDSALSFILETWSEWGGRPRVIEYSDAAEVTTLRHIVELCIQQVDKSSQMCVSLLRKVSALRGEVSRAQRIAHDAIAGHRPHLGQLDVELSPDEEFVTIHEKAPLVFSIPYPVWGIVRFDLMLQGADGSGVIDVCLLASEGDYELGLWELDYRAISDGWQGFHLKGPSDYSGFGLTIRLSTREASGTAPTLSLSATAVPLEGEAAFHSSSRWSRLPAMRLWRSGVSV